MHPENAVIARRLPHFQSFRLGLRGARRDIYMEARVLWVREYGKAGCELVRIPPVDRNIFQDWLTTQIHIKKPLIRL